MLSYCLMRNHFHPFLRTLEPDLSRFMQSPLTAFAMTMNRRRHPTADLREQPELRGARSAAGPGEWLAALAAEYGIPIQMLRSRRCRRREARDLVMYLVARYCRAGTSRNALARDVAVSLSGFVHACERVHRRLEDPGDVSHARLQAVCGRAQ